MALKDLKDKITGKKEEPGIKHTPKLFFKDKVSDLPIIHINVKYIDKYCDGEDTKK